MINRRAMSMVEIMVAVVIIGLSVGPLIGLLSSSSKMSNASIYEEMAVHYAREIADQLLRFGPRFPDIVDDAIAATGDSSISLAGILNDTGFRDKLEQHGNSTLPIALEVNGNTLPVRFILSPLDSAFTRRRLTVTEAGTSANTILKVDRFWKVKIELAWKDPSAAQTTGREVVMVVFIKEG